MTPYALRHTMEGELAGVETRLGYSQTVSRLAKPVPASCTCTPGRQMSCPISPGYATGATESPAMDSVIRGSKSYDPKSELSLFVIAIPCKIGSIVSLS